MRNAQKKLPAPPCLGEALRRVTLVHTMNFLTGTFPYVGVPGAIHPARELTKK